MNRKEILTIILLICVIFSLQAVVAADSGSNSTDSTTLSVDNDVSAYALPSSNTDTLAEVTNAGNFSQLQGIVDGMSDNEEKTLTQNYTYKDNDQGSEGISISGKTITLNGNGKVIIDANHKSRIFNIASDATVTLKGITFINGNFTGNGGSIYAEGKLTLENCKFINSTATNGGAIYFNTSSDNCKIDSCTFDDNVAIRSAGAIFLIGNYGELYNSNFTNNAALGSEMGAVAHNGTSTTGGSGGAIIWAGANGNIMHCNFYGNNATKRGGAVFLESTKTTLCSNVTFDDCRFENNTATGNGGALAWDGGVRDGTILNSVFINNTAKRNGGAIYWNGINGTVKNSQFENNRAIGTKQYSMDLDMGNTIVRNATDGSLTLGNIIVIQSSERPTDTTGYENRLVVLNSTSGKIAHFESWVVNQATGKWQQLDKINITLSESIISPVDWAIDQYYGGDGGTILWSGDVGYIYNCTFTDSNSARRGGGAYMTGCDNVTYESCNFTNCTSGTNGGGVDWLAGANYGKIYNCIFNGTRAARSAGAIYYDGWYGDMQNITIIGTKAWGGSLDNSSDGRVKYAGWDSSHWDTNTTGGDAGAIMFTGSNIKLYNVNFTDCVATSRGGAVFLQDNKNVTFDLCKFENNQALGIANNTFFDDKNISSGHNQWLTGYGGAIGFDTGATLGVIKNSKFINNTARVLGGAISFGKGSSNATISYSIFENNTAKHDGGAISWDGTNGHMDHCNFTNNRALIEDNLEETVFVLRSLSQIKNATTIKAVVDASVLPDPNTNYQYMYIVIKYNETTNKRDSYTMFVAVNNGTAYNWVALETTTETGPSTTDWAMDEYFGGDGGTIYWRGDNGVVDNCRFIDSNSARRGGAAYMTGGDHITFQNSYFENCTSGTNGGGLDWLAGANYGHVFNCTFNNTRAARSAGAIYYDGDFGDFHNITIINTTAYGGSLKSGGGVNYTGWDSSHWDTNTTGGDAGAIMITGDHVHIYNVTFTNCTATGRGGAVFLQDNNNVTFELCTFENNRALGTANNTYNDAKDTSSGLNKWYTGNGGAIAFDKGASNGTILDSKFINNTAARNGGAISFSVNSTEAYIFNSSFINNTAKRNGGAIEWDGTNGNVSYCNFTGNGAWGTAISTEYADITSLDDIIVKASRPKPSVATDNKLYVIVTKEGTKAVKYELYVSQIADKHYWLKIDETTETGPSPIDWATDEYYGGDGGSIYWGGDNATIDHCIFEDSNSARRGGGAYMTGGDYVYYINCSFENCTSGTNGGGLDWLAGANYGKVIDCNFTNTQAARSAGAIYYDGDYGEFRNVIIKNTTAHGGEINQSTDGTVKYARWDASHWDTNTTGGDGGAIMFTGDHIKLYNVNVTDCTATGRGGAIFLQDNHNVTFELCRFENNKALGTANNTFNDPYDTSSGLNENLTGHGGAIAFDMGATSSSIINSTFINNTVTGKEHHGGAVYFRQGASEDKIINSTFTLNHADEDGGAIFLEGIDCELHNSTFTSNYAGDDGGAIFWKGDFGIIYNITCENNTARSSHGNSKGGTICLNGNSISLSNSSFKQSFANVTGGAIFVTGNYVNITGCEFEDCNVTTETGGAIQIVGNHVEVRDSTFEECHAPNGGAIYAQGQYVKIIDSNFTNNNVTKDGAALYVNGDHSELHNSTFKDNVAGDDGGAIYWQGSYGTIYNITCENNKGVNDGDSNSNGGTICITGHDITLSESTFKNSSAGAQGGAIFVTGDKVNIIGLEFESCNATEEGGAIYVLGDDTTISDCTFENCNATQGGAIYVEGDRATISVSINNTRALGADSYIKLVDYKFFKDNVKEIKYAISDTIKYVLNITVDNTFTNDTIADLNNTLNDLYNAVNNILNDNGVNNTNITKALDIVSQLKANLTQLNSRLDSGKDKNITLQLISDIENIENELNYVLEVSKSLEIPANITIEIDGMIGTLDAFTPTSQITADNITTLKSDLTKINDTVKGIFNNSLFNITNITLASSLLKEFNQTLRTIDAGNVLGLYDDVEKIAKELNNISSVAGSVVIPEIISKGGAIYISGNDALIDGSVINNTEAVYGGGMYIAGHDVKVDNSEFLNLYSSEDGGAIYITGQRGHLYNSKFINNTAGDDGGAINWDGNYGKIYNITCESNRGISLNGSSSNGGSISLTGNDTSIEKSSFSQTYALISGGAIFVTGNNVNITDSEFRGCNVSMNISNTRKSYANGGGAIYVFGNYSNIVNCAFDNSEAREGGAIYVQGRDVTIDKSNFTASTALNGGTIYIDGDRAVVIACILNNTVAGNDSHALLDENLDVSAFQDGLLGKGGAIYIKSENAQILDSTITLSNATYEGGAIYVEGNNATISVDFVDCGAGYPVAWVTPDINLFKAPINDILIKVNGLIAYNNDIPNGFSDNFTSIYNSISSIRNNLVNKIFEKSGNSYKFNATKRDGAISSLTALNNAIPNMVTDSVLLDTLNLSSLIQLLLDIPDNAAYKDYYNSKVKPVYDDLATKMNYVNILGYDNSYLYNRLELIKNNLVDKIFVKINDTYYKLNITLRDAAIGNLTEFYNCVKFAEKDGSYDEFLNNIHIIIDALSTIPDNATSAAYNKVSSDASKKINSLMTYSRNVEKAYVAYKNNLGPLKNNLNKLKQQTTLKTFNNVMYDAMVNIANIKNFDLLVDAYAGGDLTKVSDNFTYVKSQLELIQNAAESLHNMGIKGGAIYVAGNDTNITGSTFLRCLVSNALKGEGGAIYINGVNTTITGSDFMNCSAPDNGGSIYIDGKNAKVEKSNFNKTSVEYRGGAIYIEGSNATVKDSNFTDSAVTGGMYENTNPRGGAIYIKADDAVVEGSIFNHSSVSNTVGQGGAIYIEGEDAKILGSEFELSSAYAGGAIYIEGDEAKILGSEFESSSANTGGAIYLEGDECNVSDSLFNNSYAVVNGGAMYSTGSSSIVYNSNFTYNLAELSGGAVYWFGGSKSKYNTVDGCIFINNTAHGNTTDTSVTRGGGAIYWSENGEKGTVKNSKFYYNSVQSTIDKKVDGGAILWDKSKHALVDNCIFVGNFVITNGDTSGTLASDVWAQGGAMYLRPTANYTVRNCHFENCSSSKEAGALYIQGQTSGTTRMILLENSVFINNVAYAKGQYNINGGGAIQIKQCTQSVFNNLTFINNTANKGGALSVFDSVTYLEVNGANFTGNKAVKGSAISASRGFTLNNAVLIENRANTTQFDLDFDRTGGNINILLEGGDTHLNSMYMSAGKTTDFNVTLNNVTYWTNNNISTGKTSVTSSSQSPVTVKSVPEKGISITVELFDANNNKLNVGNDTFATDENGELHLTPTDFGRSSFDDVYVVARLTNEDYYTQVENTTRLPVTMEVVADNVTYHRNATVHVIITPDTTSPENASGNISVYYGDVFLGNITVNNNTGDAIEKILTNITADRFLEVGKHNLTLRYWGDLYNDAINMTVPINVTKAQSNITFSMDDIGYDLFVRVNIVDDWNDEFYADATGNVTISVYGRDLTVPIQSKTVYLVNGTGMTFFDLLPANYTINATYHGDKNYNSSVNSTIGELHKKEDVRIRIDVNADNIMVDETVYINITVVTPEGYEAKGNITVYLDNEKYILPLTDSKAQFNATGLSAGSKIVTACYDGSRDLQANYGDANFTVLKYNTTFTIGVTNITHNQNEIINITFLNETEGVVYIFVNDGNYSAPINNRTAILELSNLTVGEHNVTVKFPGDWKYNNVTNMTRFYVEQITPDVIIDVDNVTYGNPTIVVINVPDCAKGNVTIKIDGTQYGERKQIINGRAEFDLGMLNPGEYKVEAIYGGDANHTAATSEQKFKVYKDNRTVTIDVQDIVYGDTEHIKVHVNATGTVTINVNGKSETITLNESGDAVWDVHDLSAKSYTVDVVYNGNDYYNKSSASATFTVSPMSTTLEVNVHDVVVRGMEYMNITVRNSTGGIATNLNGTLTINIDGVDRTVNIVNGTATFNSAEFNKVVGKRVVWVFYEGDENFTASKAMETYQVNTRLLQNSEWNITAQNITIGQAGNITVKLPKDATGFVEIEVEAYDKYRDDVYYVPVKNGEAVVYPMDLRGGYYHVFATYRGDDYEEDYLDTFFSVTKANVNVIIDVNDTVFDGASDIVVYVGDVEGSITLKINKTVIGTFPVFEGKVTTTVKLGAGNYTVYAEYNGNYMYYDNKTESKSFTVAKAVPAITIDSVIVNANTNPVIVVHINDTATGTINITVNGENYTADIIDGVATFDMIPVLHAGIYNVTANYYALTDTNYTVGYKFIDVGVTVNKIYPYEMNVSAIDVAVEDNTTIVVTVPTDATGNVTIWVNGTKINKTITDNTGKVVFTLNRTVAGKYFINATLTDVKYADQTVYTNYCVYKVDTPITIISITDPVYVDGTATITVTVPEGIKGIVTIEIDGKKYYNKTVNGGTITFEVPNLTYGNKTVVATYGGDNKYRFNSTTKNFTVSKFDVNVNITVKNITYGEKVNITVNVTDKVSGFITISINDTWNKTLPIKDGVVNWMVDDLAAGNYTVHAIYEGTGKFNVNSNSKTFEVNRVISAITIEEATADAATNATIVVRINETATGNITITVNGTKYNATIENGVATFTINKLLAGKYNITAEYIGDDNNTPVTSTTLVDGLTVTKVACYQINVTADDTKVDLNTTIVVKVPGDASGKVSIYIDGDLKYNATIDHGVAKWNVTMPYGNHTVNVTFTDGKYGFRYATTDYWVFKHDAPLHIDVDSIYVGDAAYINVTAPSDDVTIEINGKEYDNGVYDNGKVRFVVTGLAYGNKTVVAIYGGNYKYVANSTTKNFTVSKRNSQVNVTATGNSVGNNATISVNVTNTATGYVVVNVNGTNYTINLTGSRGSVQIAGLKAGTYYVHATYIGDDKYKSSNNNTQTFTMTKSNVIMNVTVASIDYGQKANITVNITSDATGFITIRINNTRSITLPIDNGKVNWIVDGLAADNYTVYANYSGDGKYNLNNTNKVNKSFEVRQISPNVAIIKIIAEAGKNATIIVKVDPRTTENITVNVNRDYSIKPNAEGIAVIVTDVLENGTYTVAVSYPGDKNFTSGGVQVDVVTNKSSDYLINVTAGDIEVEDNTNIVVNVPADAKGIVIVNINGTNYTARIVQGRAVFNNETTGLFAGRYNITAYFGNDKYENKTATGVFYINKHASTITIDADSILVGDTAYINVTAPSGDVTIEINGKEYDNGVYNNGKVRFVVTGLAYGNKTVVAIYGGNYKYVANSTTKNFTVSKRSSEINVTATGNSVGSNATISVNVTATATGYVVVNVNGTNYTINLTGSRGSVQIAGLKAGTYYVHVTYIGDDKYKSSNNNTQTFTMTKSNVIMNVTVASIDYGQKANITVNITSDATGFITIRINNTRSITLPIDNGKVNWIVDGLAADNYTVYANYSGDGKYNLNNTNKVNKSFEVNLVHSVLSIDAPVSVDAATNATIIVRVNDTATGNITITVNGTKYNATIENGVATFTINKLLADTYDITAEYIGDGNNTPATTVTAHNALVITKVVCYQINVTANDTIVDFNTTVVVKVPVDAVGNVSICIDGTIKHNATINHGVAEWNVTMPYGNHTVNVTFTDGKYGFRYATTDYWVFKHASPVVIHPNSIYVGDTAYINVDAPTDNVTIEINGQSYTRDHYSNGVAYFVVSGLAYGNKTVVAIYGGDSRYVANSTTENFTVSKRISSINVTTTNSTVDGNVRINVTVPDNAGGYVVANVNGTNYTINLTGGKGEVSFKVLENGTYDVVVTYVGDDQYLPSNNVGSFKVDKILPNINATVTNNGIIGNGSDVDIFICAPSDITGKVNVTVWDMDKNINTTYIVYVNEGEGILHLAAPGIGNYRVNVTYLENRKYLENTNCTEFEIYDNEKALNVVSDSVSVFENERVVVYLTGDQTGNNLTIIITNANGEIIINENVPIEHYIPLLNGSSAEWTLPILLEAGHYDVKAIYTEHAGPRTYIHEGNNSFEVYKVASEIIIKEIKNITVGQNVTIELEVTSGATGDISIFVNGLEHKTTTDNLIITIPNLGADVYVVEAFYYGDENYNASDDTSSFRVDKNTVTLSIDTANLGDVEQINVTVGNNATGQILLDIEDNHYYANITNGIAQFNITGLKAGKHNVTARYIENFKYYGNTTNSSFTISKYKPDFTINGTNIDFGRAEVITIETKDIITSLVTVEVNGENHTTFIKDGKGNLTLTDLAAGDYNITLYFPASEKYESATAKNNFTVSQIAPDIHIVIENITYGEVETITVYVNAEGNVTIKVGDYYGAIEEPIVDGVVSVNVPGLNANNYTVNVTYNGNANFTAYGAEANFTVEKADPIISIDVENIVHGDVEYIVVHVNAEGNVTITINGTDINETISLENGHKIIILRASRWDVPKYEGTASLDVHNLAVGRYNVVATYNGNENYNTATATAEFNVTKADSPIKLNADTYIKVGDNATITVELPENATGNVTVYIDGKEYPGEIKDGVAVVTIDDLTAGNKTYVVEYSGDGNFSANYTIGNLTVKEAKSTPDMKVIDQGNGTVVVVVGDNASGNVTIKVGDKEYNATVVNGTAVVELDGNVTPGTHEVEVIYSGDGTHEATNATVNVTAPKYPSEIKVDVYEVTEGEPLTVTVEVPNGATGNVTVYVDGKEYSGEIKDGVAVVTIDDLTAGDKTFVVEYSGDGNFSANYAIGNVTVKEAKSTPDMKVIDQGNGTVVVVVGDNASGNVTIKVGDKEYNATVVNGTAVVQLDGNVTPGTHKVDVIYSGDGTHEATNATVNVTAPKYPSEIKVDVSEVTEGEPLTVTVEVPNGATGNVTVYVDGKEYSGEIKDGVAVVTIDDLTAGDKTYVVEYSGDGNFSANYAIGNVTVKEAKSTPDMKVVDYGNGTVVVVVGDNASGNVTIKVGDKEYNATVVNGTAVVQLDGNVTPGTHKVDVIYSGDDTHKASNATAEITAPKYDSPINITVGVIESGENGTIVVELPEGANGNVTVYVDGKEFNATVVNGTAVVRVENLTAGPKTVVVEYSGDGTYLASHAISELTVSKRPSYVSASIVDIDVGENVTIVVTVPNDATGQVLIDIDGVGYYVNVTNGVGSTQIPRMPNGIYPVNLTYVGDDKYLPSANNTIFNVNKVPSYVIPTAKNIAVGKNEIIVFEVPKDATGNLTIIIDGKQFTFDLDEILGVPIYDDGKFSVAVSDGKGVLVLSGLPAGAYNVTVTYNGNYKYLKSTNTTTFKVGEKDTELTVVDQGNGTVKVFVSDDAKGNITIKVENQTYTAEIVDGVAIINLDNVSAGKHDIEVDYSGDDKHPPKTVESSVSIPKKATPISVATEDIYVGDIEHIVVTVPEGATGIVSIEINAIQYNATIENGKAIFDVKGLSLGKKTVAVTYWGDGNYVENFTTGQFEVKKLPSDVDASSKDIKVGKDANIKITVPSDATGSVTVRIDGVDYSGKIVNGKVTISVPNLSAGEYDAVVTYYGDSKYLPSVTITRFEVIKNTAPISANKDYVEVGDDGTVTVNLPSDATGTVTIEVDGKIYTSDVVNGQAKFKIPGLSKGDHKVDVYYSGDDKYKANETITEIVVKAKVPDPDDGGHHDSHRGYGIDLSNNKTGNPILILLLIILAIGSTQLRRFKK